MTTSTFIFTPPESLIFDDINVDDGTFNITRATSFFAVDGVIEETENIPAGQPVTVPVTIGENASPVEFFNFPEETSFLQIAGFFDPGDAGGDVANFNITAGPFTDGVADDLEIFLPTSLTSLEAEDSSEEIEILFQVTDLSAELPNNLFTLASEPPEFVLLPDDGTIPDNPFDNEDAPVEGLVLSGRVLFPPSPFVPFNDDDSQPGGRGEGDPHLTTFDGLEYDFHAIGEYTLVETVDENLEVQIITEQDLAVEDSEGSYITSVATNIGDDTIEFNLDNSSEDILFVNGQATSLASGNIVVLEDGLISFNNDESDSYIINYLSGEKLIVEYNNLETEYFNVDFDTSETPVVGLLGNSNGDTTDDLALRDGTILTQPVSYDQINSELAVSWTVALEDSLFV